MSLLSSTKMLSFSLLIFLLTLGVVVCQEGTCENEQCKEKLTNGKFLDFAMQYHDSVAFLIAVQLEVPQWMAHSAKITAETTAAEFGITKRAASALLVTLCRMEVVEVVEDDDYSIDNIIYDITPSAEKFLSSDQLASFTSPFVQTFANNFMSVDTLLASFRPNPEKDLMSAALEETDEEVGNNARQFMGHMNAQSYSCAEALPSALSLEGSDEKKMTMLDVGGGSGIYTIAAVQANPNLSGVIFEKPGVVPITQEYIEDAGLSSRIEVKGGDFFNDGESFPVENADIVLFSNILHDWPDETNLKLIRKAFDCLQPGGRIVISELLITEDVKSSSSAVTSMNIILIPWTQGRQYRAKELFRRLEDAGFVNTQELDLVDDYSLVVGEKPKPL